MKEKGREMSGKCPHSRLKFQFVLKVDKLLEGDEVARDRPSGPAAITMKASFTIVFTVKQRRGLIEAGLCHRARNTCRSLVAKMTTSMV